MAARKKRLAFSLVLEGDAARVRKTHAPACRPHEDRRRKQPRHRPDLLANRDDFRPDA